MPLVLPTTTEMTTGVIQYVAAGNQTQYRSDPVKGSTVATANRCPGNNGDDGAVMVSRSRDSGNTETGIEMSAVRPPGNTQPVDVKGKGNGNRRRKKKRRENHLEQRRQGGVEEGVTKRITRKRAR